MYSHPLGVDRTTNVLEKHLRGMLVISYSLMADEDEVTTNRKNRTQEISYNTHFTVNIQYM